MSDNVQSHKAAFDAHYSKLLEQERGLGIAFPLRDIEKFQWKRGEWNDAFYNWTYRRFSVHILHRLAIPAGGSVLAIGCGFGFDEKNIRNLHPDASIWSLDISEEMVVRARAAGCPATLSLAMAEKLPFPDASFDRVVSREVIEHVMDPQVMLSEIRRVLKPGGLAVITTENPLSLSPHNYFTGTIRPLIARLTGYHLKTKAYKDDAPTVHRVREMCAAAGLELREVIWDGAVYKYLPSLNEVYRERMVEVGRSFTSLENSQLLGRLFCDQVKYVIARPDTPSAAGERPRFICPACRAALADAQGDSIRCTACPAVYPLRQGIPDFIIYSPSSSAAPQPEPEAPVNSLKVTNRYNRIHIRASRIYDRLYHALARLACRFAPANSDAQPSARIPADHPLNTYLKMDR